jgi:hypothetical protein
VIYTVLIDIERGHIGEAQRDHDGPADNRGLDLLPGDIDKDGVDMWIDNST